MGIVFVAAQVILGFFAWKYRDGGSSAPARYSHGNNSLEIIWTVLTFILFVGLNLMSSSIWASERFRPAGPEALPVEVTGMQFAWYFRYAGPYVQRRCGDGNDVLAGESRSGFDPASS